MKKYLMTGVAALAICAAFTSCSKSGEELYNQGAIDGMNQEKVIENYNARFLAYVGGSIAPDQDWGFGSASTRVADPRGNMWEAEGWNVPPVITDQQKDIVRRYFQQNTPLGYNDPGWSDFWIQQVYKGGTKTTDGSQTTEKYRIGNGDMVTGGNHMDHLCSKSASGVEDHINDFNNSDNNDWEGRMLMVSSSTYSFGYINSNATAIHYDKAALVSWRVIAQWAVDNGLESSVEASVLNDGWNRSYMGFDWEQALPDDCYKPIYDYSVGWSADLPGGFPLLGYETFEFEGNTYRFLSANANQYAYDESEPTYGGIENYSDRPSDATIRELLSLGYLPYSDTLKDWIKLSTGADGYYSDWIVTLTKAEQDTPPTPPTPPTRNYSIRVLGEDLTFANTTSASGVDITDADEGADFDFNDVVFDVAHVTNGTADENGTWIRVMAAGGTLPLYIGSVAEANEVHHMFGQPTTKMINTNAPSGISGLDPIEYKYSDGQVNAKEIAIIVIKDGIQFTLSANRGEPASKIAVSNMNFQWTNERQSIKKKYPQFAKWAQEGQTVISEWWN
jgi:hypothetical protein